LALCSEQVGSVCSWTPHHQTSLDESKQFIAATSGGHCDPNRKKRCLTAELIMMMMIIAVLEMWLLILQLVCGQKRNV